MEEFTTTHKLAFEVANNLNPLLGNHALYRIGTCTGQWGCTADSYWILSILNRSPGNGHLQDVFEWFENSCKRDNKNLLVLSIFSKRFYEHLILKRGFIPLDEDGENVIKVFNRKAYRMLKKKGNEILQAGT